MIFFSLIRGTTPGLAPRELTCDKLCRIRPWGSRYFFATDPDAAVISDILHVIGERLSVY